MAVLRYNKLSTVQRKVAFESAEFVIQKFMPRLIDKISIRFKGIDGLLEREGIYGDCDYEIDGPTIRDFVIRVDNKLKLNRFAQVIMHEMVHVKQYAKGELKQLERVEKPTYRWRGDRITTDKLDYYDLPWEIEAHGREWGLVSQFCSKNPDWYEFLMIVEDELDG